MEIILYHYGNYSNYVYRVQCKDVAFMIDILLIFVHNILLHSIKSNKKEISIVRLIPHFTNSNKFVLYFILRYSLYCTKYITIIYIIDT